MQYRGGEEWECSKEEGERRGSAVRRKERGEGVQQVGRGEEGERRGNAVKMKRREGRGGVA